jgi:hypothetical protein
MVPYIFYAPTFILGKGTLCKRSPRTIATAGTDSPETYLRGLIMINQRFLNLILAVHPVAGPGLRPFRSGPKAAQHPTLLFSFKIFVHKNK